MVTIQLTAEHAFPFAVAISYWVIGVLPRSCASFGSCTNPTFKDSTWVAGSEARAGSTGCVCVWGVSE